MLIGLWPTKASALVLLAAVGAATTIVGVAGDTLMQRAVPEEVLARVFGVLDSMMLVAVAIGAAAAPFLIDGLGTQGTLLVLGAVLPLLAAASWRRLREIDAAAELVPRRQPRSPARQPDLRAAPTAPAGGACGGLEERHAAAGETIVAEGEHGDEFFLVAEGRVSCRSTGPRRASSDRGGVRRDRAPARVPRTATVRAADDTTLFVLDRAQFLGALQVIPTARPRRRQSPGVGWRPTARRLSSTDSDLCGPSSRSSARARAMMRSRSPKRTRARRARCSSHSLASRSSICFSSSAAASSLPSPSTSPQLAPALAQGIDLLMNLIQNGHAMKNEGDPAAIPLGRTAHS